MRKYAASGLDPDIPPLPSLVHPEAEDPSVEVLKPHILSAAHHPADSAGDVLGAGSGRRASTSERGIASNEFLEVFQESGLPGRSAEACAGRRFDKLLQCVWVACALEACDHSSSDDK